VVAAVLLAGGDQYRVKARFASATGAVEGGLVRVAGRSVGRIEDIHLTADGQAELELSISEEAVVPLRRGTIAALRSPGLSSSAAKYVDLRIPSGTGPPIAEGGVIDQTQTSSSVDLDQLFATFDGRARSGLRKVVRGSARMTAGRSEGANEGWHYLNPALVASQRLFREIGGDRVVLERFLVDTSRLVGDLAERRSELTELVDGLADTTGALASRDQELSDTIERLPPFLRRANTTFVNLRATLTDLDGLIADTKPVTPKLRRALAELRPFARESVPTLRDLAALTQRPGGGNDLVELYESFPALRDIAVRSAVRNGERRPGSFPASAAAFRSSRDPLAYLRAYAVELTGWFDDFGHSGIYDAFGNASRVATVISPATLTGLLPLLPEDVRGPLADPVILRGQRNRCPGSMERPAEDGSNPWKPTKDFNCDPTQIPLGP
jgi:phospholipid/cholesterol/gamma-HCH transport system substrate-binding protein